MISLMITKTIKTILFASLIAALILPFSAMDFAEAVKSTEKTISNSQKIQSATTNSRTDSFDLQVLKYTCNEYVLAEIKGTLTQYDTHSFWNVSADYPSTIECDKHSPYIELILTDLTGSSSSTCTIFFWMPSDSENVFCDGFGLADDAKFVNLIKIQSNAYYDDGDFDPTPFTKKFSKTLIIY